VDSSRGCSVLGGGLTSADLDPKAHPCPLIHSAFTLGSRLLASIIMKLVLSCLPRGTGDTMLNGY
jgi:hypothetical protein